MSHTSVQLGYKVMFPQPHSWMKFGNWLDLLTELWKTLFLECKWRARLEVHRVRSWRVQSVRVSVLVELGSATFPNMDVHQFSSPIPWLRSFMEVSSHRRGQLLIQSPAPCPSTEVRGWGESFRFPFKAWFSWQPAPTLLSIGAQPRVASLDQKTRCSS